MNHDNYDLAWLPNDEENLLSIRAVFRQNNIPNNFKGGVICYKEDILPLVRDIVWYPVEMFPFRPSPDSVFPDNRPPYYRNIDISHSQLPFLIKISSLFCVDVLSTDVDTLRMIADDVVTEEHQIIEYRGTWLYD
jgi:hypothetical protein